MSRRSIAGTDCVADHLTVSRGTGRTHKGSRVDKRGYLYEIVANGRNCIDVDKFDYLARDMLNLFGVRKVFNFSRLTMFNRVIGDQICYHTSVNLDIYDMFQQRYQMHKQIYNHRKGKAVEYMICDAMLLAGTCSASSWMLLLCSDYRRADYSPQIASSVSRPPPSRPRSSSSSRTTSSTSVPSSWHASSLTTQLN